MDFPDSGNCVDRSYELLADDQCVYYVIEDRFQCKHAVESADI